MKPGINTVIFAEYGDSERFSLSASTDKDGLFLTLTLRDIKPDKQAVKEITMTDREFKRLAESLGYKRSVFNNMDEILTDREFDLIDDWMSKPIT